MCEIISFCFLLLGLQKVVFKPQSVGETKRHCHLSNEKKTFPFKGKLWQIYKDRYKLQGITGNYFE